MISLAIYSNLLNFTTCISRGTVNLHCPLHSDIQFRDKRIVEFGSVNPSVESDVLEELDLLLCNGVIFVLSCGLYREYIVFSASW